MFPRNIHCLSISTRSHWLLIGINGLTLERLYFVSVLSDRSTCFIVFNRREQNVRWLQVQYHGHAAELHCRLSWREDHNLHNGCHGDGGSRCFDGGFRRWVDSELQGQWSIHQSWVLRKTRFLNSGSGKDNTFFYKFKLVSHNKVSVTGSYCLRF